MEVQEIKPPRCKCGAWSELTVTDNGWYIVKCPSCGTTSEEQATLEDAVGSFLAKIYKTPLACFIGCFVSELKQVYYDDVIIKVMDAANNNDYATVSNLIKDELDKLNGHK